MTVLLEFAWLKARQMAKTTAKSIFGLLAMSIFLIIIIGTVSLAAGLVLWSVSFGQLFSFGWEEFRPFGWGGLTTCGLMLIMASIVVGCAAAKVDEWAGKVSNEYRHFKVAKKT